MHVEMSMHAATAIEWFMVVLLLISFYYSFHDISVCFRGP